MISIIVPVFNTSAYLKQCIQSILLQSYKDFELILIDNGSTDCSRKICEEAGRTDSRVIALHKDHGSISSARNLGLKYAKGEFITFVDSDDLLEKDALECLYKAAIDEKADIVSLLAKRMYIDAVEEKQDSNERWIGNEIDFLCAWLCEHKLGGEVWGKLFRANVVREVFFPEQRCEDMVYLFEAIKRSNKNVLIDSHLYLYRMHRNSAEASEYRRPVEDEKVDCFKTILSYIENKYPEYHNKFFGAATKSIFGSVMRIYAAQKDEQQHQYLDNAYAFLSIHEKAIMHLDSLSIKQKLLIGLFCNSRKVFKIVFKFRNGMMKK